MHYLDTDSLNNVLSGQKVQRVRVESENKHQQNIWEGKHL